MKLNDINVDGYDTILLDRDGTINRHRINDYVKCWNEFEFLPDVFEAIARFSLTAKHIFVVTNQRGVAKGKYTEAQLAEIHQKMVDVIKEHGGRIDRIYYSIGMTDEDHTRKPNTGMWEQICNDYPDIIPSKTVMIGDGDCDMEFAHNCGIKGIRVEKQNVIETT